MVNDKPHFLPAHFYPDYEFFCQLPRDKNPSDLGPCLASFFTLQTPIETQCQPTCRRLLAPIVTEARAGVFWVIPREADRLAVDCPAQVEDLPSIRIGSYAVVLPSDVLVTPHLLCGKSVLWNGRGEDRVTLMKQCEVPIERVEQVSSES